jgi:hypothetical protein
MVILHHDNRCPVSDGLVNELVAVLHGAPDGNEEMLALNTPGVVLYPGHLDVPGNSHATILLLNHLDDRKPGQEF